MVELSVREEPMQGVQAGQALVDWAERVCLVAE